MNKVSCDAKSYIGKTTHMTSANSVSRIYTKIQLAVVQEISGQRDIISTGCPPCVLLQMLTMPTRVMGKTVMDVYHQRMVHQLGKTLLLLPIIRTKKINTH